MGPFEIFLISLAAIFFLYSVWFLLFADCDLSLNLKILFGRPVSVFEGKVIWITGATGSLGEAMAYELASVGAKLILSARNVERLEQVKKKCSEVYKGGLESADILVLPFDITDYDDQKNKLSVALDHFQQVDVLINCAGRAHIGSSGKTIIDVDRDLLNINYLGPVQLAKLMLSHFQEKGEGQIVCISSFLGRFAAPGSASYTATKHALHGFFDTVRIEYSSQNIKVTMICPGLFQSEILDRAMTETGEMHMNVIHSKVHMSSARCAHLSLVAAANNSYEAWISHQPMLLLPYFYQWLPDCGIFFTLLFCTERTISEFIQGNYGNTNRSWKPLFSRY